MFDGVRRPKIGRNSSERTLQNTENSPKFFLITLPSAPDGRTLQNTENPPKFLLYKAPYQPGQPFREPPPHGCPLGDLGGGGR